MRDKQTTHYDYIVVGAGPAGSVVAAELSAAGATVIVVESGGLDEAPTITNPSLWFTNVGGPLDYNLPITPSPRLNNRKLTMALGHVLGGGSSINAMVWTRGMQRDYDEWAKSGAKGWGWADTHTPPRRSSSYRACVHRRRAGDGNAHLGRHERAHASRRRLHQHEHRR